MKNLCIITFVCIANFALSQKVLDLPNKQFDTEYIQIIGSENLTNNKNSITIENGKEANQVTTKIEGINAKFNSMIEALNFVCSKGYSLNSVYTNTKNDIVYTYYILKKKSEKNIKWFSQ